MDLCLRGSQINLVTRQKPKAKYSSQFSFLLLQQHPHQHQHQHSSRPCSANYLTQNCGYSSSNRASTPFGHCHLRRRPRSAEAKFGRRSSSVNSSSNCSLQQQQQNNQQRYKSISSSNLLKLLLDEPIKRPWLCRGAGRIRSGSASPVDKHFLDWSTSAHQQQYQEPQQRQCEQHQRQHCESVCSSNSSIVDHSERVAKGASAASDGKMSTISVCPKNNSTYNNTSNTAKMYASNDYWKPTNSSSSDGSNSNLTSVITLPSTSGCSKILKPDLPGRVSFCKGSNLLAQPDADDSSDCENERQQDVLFSTPSTAHNSLSVKAPTIANSTTEVNTSTTAYLSSSKFQYTSPTTPTTTMSHATTEAAKISATKTTIIDTLNTDFYNLSAAQKKSVHFGTVGSADIYAETYEYPKCPSENCSCSTRSSSTASLHDVPEGKCACAVSTCRHALNVKAIDSSSNASEAMPTTTTTKKITNQNLLEESAVIREYKNVIGEHVENSIVKNLLGTDDKNFGHLNDGELLKSDYLESLSCMEKKNNLYETAIRNNVVGASTSFLYKNSKHNLLSSSGDIEGGDENTLNQVGSAESSETVINNYLKVTGGGVATSGDITDSADDNTTVLSSKVKKQENAKSKPVQVMATTRYRRFYNGKKFNHNNNLCSSNNNNTLKSHNTNVERATRLFKATSYESIRGDDTNLNEFQLDKVDSWMSIHQADLNGGIDGDVTSKSLSKLPTSDVNNVGTCDDEVLPLSKLNGKFKLQRLENESNLPLDGKEDADDDESGERLEQPHDDDENSHDDSTYDEIVSVIKEIEEDKKYDNYAESSSEKNLKLHTPTSDANTATIINDKQIKPATTTVSTNTPRISLEISAEPVEELDKYKDILNYLDHVEDSCDKTLLETRRSMPESNRGEIEFIVEPDIVEDVPKLADLLLLPNHQLARRVIALSLRANELANGLHLSKKHVSTIRTEKQKCVRAEKANTAQRLRDQKKHYEIIVQRHQGFIEQLLKDKATLCEKVAALTRRLESQNQAWEHKLETEVTRVKETTLAGEKIRRERWVRDNTKKIKDLTVKGLEQEINKMNNVHQSEINELKRAHQQELLDSVEEARIKHEQIENAIRQTCAQDREAIIEKERNVIRERFERQVEEDQRSFDEQKQKLVEDFAVERERFQRELKAKEADYEQRRHNFQREKELELEQALNELQQRISKQEEKYQNRINTIERQYESDIEIWKREYENSSKLAQVDKENSIRQHYCAERDRQIDAIVTRMDAESLKNSKEFEAKVIRLKEKYEKDLLEVENVEKSVREKYADMRSKLAESDAQVRNFQAEIKQLRIELEHSKKMCNDFISERDQLRENLRQEIQNEVGTLKAERDQEIQKIHKRVHQAIEKKDATIDILQKENGDLRERCLKLEAIIRQQRKDYCVK